MVHNDFYSCFYYAYCEGKLIPNYNTACWAGLMEHNITTSWIFNYDRDRRTNPIYTKMDDDNIYITRFKNKNIPLAHTKRVISLINQITPCKLVTVKGEKYIKYTLVQEGSYYPNLLLLNFIRMCWYKPALFNYNGYYKNIMKYKVGADPLYFLLNSVRKNVNEKGKGYASYMNHSIVTLDIIPKTVGQFEEYEKGMYNKDFITRKLS